MYIYRRLRVFTGVSDPDSIGSAYSNPDLEEGSGSREAKLFHKKRKKEISFMFEHLKDLNIICTRVGVKKTYGI
jgi:hypothetical protein